MDIAEIRLIFVEEAEGHLSAFENGILALEKDLSEQSAIHDIFRAVHTVKGAAGMVGMMATSNFAHAAETYLDEVRAGTAKLSQGRVSLLLRVHDALGLVIEHEAAGAIEPSLKLEIESLVAALAGEEPAAAAISVAPARPLPSQPAAALAPQHAYTLEIRCRGEMAQNGFDPLAFIRYLNNLGEISDCKVVHSLAHIQNFDPEILYLGFDVTIKTRKPLKEIEEVFSLAGDLVSCKVSLAVGASPHLALPGGSQRPLPINGEGGKGAESTSPSPPVGRGAGGGDKPKNFLRVESDRLDSLIDSIGEIVMTGATLKALPGNEQNEPYQDQMALLERQVETMRDTAMQLRTFSLNEVFKRFERVVRDVSTQAGKEVRLEIFGGETEIDKTLMDGVYDPLVHIIRNSVDHGIESAQLRRERGKSPIGLITVKAERMAGMIYITVEDDGGGPNFEKIEKRARERGLLKDGSHSEKEIIEMVFQPGFSTAEQVTALSGRGVGMDVVRQNVNRLNGSVAMTRAPGGGTRVSIRLPLTLAIIDGLVVESLGHRYVIPLDQVIECVDYEDFAASSAATATGIFNLRGEALPIISLGQLFAEPNAELRERVVVVVHRADKRYGIFVNRPLGEQQIVVKPIENIPGIPSIFNGATILGDSRVALILDLAQLIESISKVVDTKDKALVGTAEG